MEKTFSFDTIKNFDDHILQSIPNYDLLFKTVVALSDYFICPNTDVLDIGCSTGKLLKTLHEKNDIDCKYIGFDISKNLLPDNTNDKKLTFNQLNLNYDTINVINASLIFSIFTLQFLNFNVRQDILDRIYRGLNKGGAFIMAEKVYCETGKHQDIFNSTYYEFKKASFTEKQILDKEVDLRKILKPSNHDTNIDMLKTAGFNSVQVFYKFLNFEAYLCVKD